MIIDLTYEQAVNIVGECSGKVARIKDKLVKNAGYSAVETVGRGKKTIFKCSIDIETTESSTEVYHKQFRQRLIEKCGFGQRFDYDSVLKVLEFHLINKEKKMAMSIEDLAKEIGISTAKIKRFRTNLKEILTDRETSEKVLFGLHEGENIYRKIDDELLNNIIYRVYARELKRIEKMFPNPHISDEVAIFIDTKVGTYRLVPRTGDFDFVKENLIKAGCYYQSSYAVSFGGKVARNERGRRVISNALKRKIFDLICKENHIEHTVDRFIYTIREEILEDDEFMNEMVNAIYHREESKLRAV
nr:MAG: hypothetical protein [Bacteriophage sp.]